MGRAIADVEAEVLVNHLSTNWTRTALATFDRQVVVPDPGHGHDEVCPIVYLGQHLNVDDDAAVGAISPFTAAELRGFDTGASRQPGIGWAVVDVRESGRAQTLVTGNPVIKRQGLALRIHFALPARSGPVVAQVYAAAAASIFDGQRFSPGEANIDEIRHLPQNSIQEQPTYRGDDDTGWSWYQMEIPLDRVYRSS